jgi:hypothetical protein
MKPEYKINNVVWITHKNYVGPIIVIGYIYKKSKPIYYKVIWPGLTPTTSCVHFPVSTFSSAYHISP